MQTKKIFTPVIWCKALCGCWCHRYCIYQCIEQEGSINGSAGASLCLGLILLCLVNGTVMIMIFIVMVVLQYKVLPCSLEVIQTMVIILLSWSPPSLIFRLKATKHKQLVAESKTKQLSPSQHPPSHGTSQGLDSRGTWLQCAARRGASESFGWASGPPAGFHGQGGTQGCIWAGPGGKDINIWWKFCCNVSLVMTHYITVVSLTFQLQILYISKEANSDE